MTRQLPASNYRFGLVLGWGIYAECAQCKQFGRNAPAGMLTTAADLMGFANVHERIYHPELSYQIRMPKRPAVATAGVLDHQLFFTTIRCSDDRCPCEMMDDVLDVPSTATVAEIMSALMRHRKQFPIATREGEAEVSPEVMEAWNEAAGVNPVEASEDRGFVALFLSSRQGNTGRIPFRGPFAQRREEKALCRACGHPAERHHGDVGCLEQTNGCTCTHPTGVA